MDSKQIQLNQNDPPPPTSDLILVPQLVKTESTQQLSSSPDLCRICLSNDHKLISPCNCKGSIEMVHQSCLKTWILSGKTYECFTYETEREVQCEICHCPIRFYLYKKKKCGLQNFYKNLKYQRVFVIVHMVLILLFIASILVMVKAITDTLRKQGTFRMEEPTFIAVSTLCGILTFFLGGLIYRLVVENFIFMKYVISKVVDNRESKIVIRQGTH